jgi:hypothetical protein
MLRKFLPILLGAAAIAATPAAAEPRLTPEQQLEKELRGRVAGEPVKCINLFQVRHSRVIDKTAIIFGSGGTIYVNRPRAGADALSRWDAQLVKPFGTQLCSVDTIQMFDRTSGFYSGNVFLGDFVPYRRVRD